MAEGTYEYECMRAELLGIEKPDYEEFLKNKKEQDEVANEEIDIENLKEADLEDESFGRIGGKFDELNNILKSTHKKINRFRASCGSLTNLLKMKISNSNIGSSESLASGSCTDSHEQTDSNAPGEENSSENSENGSKIEGINVRKSDLAKAMDKHVDCLDSLIEKAENAEYSMKYQRKQMDKMIKK